MEMEFIRQEDGVSGKLQPGGHDNPLCSARGCIGRGASCLRGFKPSLATTARVWESRSVMSAFTPIERLFDPTNGIFTVETASRLLGLRPTEEEVTRLEYLGEQANEGKLTDDERDEYETRVRLGKFISIMQLKARLLLRTAGAR